MNVRRGGISTEQWLLKHRRVDLETGCWLWTRGIFSSGYGAVRVNGTKWIVSRLMATIVNGPIADGVCVLHTCDNRRCFRPSHLFLGTKTDNMTDMVNKGRSSMGERRYCAKLCEDDIPRIVALRKQGCTYIAIAKVCEVAETTIRRVLDGSAWKHVPRGVKSNAEMVVAGSTIGRAV